MWRFAALWSLLRTGGANIYAGYKRRLPGVRNEVALCAWGTRRREISFQAGS